MSEMERRGANAASPLASAGTMRTSEAANLGDILERVLDKGIVIAGDIQVNLLDIELLTIKLRLLVASVDTARQMGINWWEDDPGLSAGGDDRRTLRDRVRRLERQLDERTAGSNDAGDD